MSDVDPTNDNAISPLVATLLTASLTQTQRLTTSVVDQLGTRLAEREAELAAIRDGVRGLLDGPYLPHPDAIVRALWPAPDLVMHYLDKGKRNHA